MELLAIGHDGTMTVQGKSFDKLLKRYTPARWQGRVGSTLKTVRNTKL